MEYVGECKVLVIVLFVHGYGGVGGLSLSGWPGLFVVV